MPRRAVLIALAVAAVLIAGRLGIERDGDPAPDGVEATVTRIVDGDTVHVDLDGGDETVRYIGVDTPESVKPGTPIECFAKEAASRNAELVDGEDVTLRFDVERRDRYGRLLAYVYRTRDGAFVNERLVREGYATPLTIPPNVRHADRFAQLARGAREARRGLWHAC